MKEINTFSDFELSPEIKHAIELMGIKEPTSIQAQSIPLILDGKDVIGESATGSGKTLAFGCGLVENATHREGIQGLVITPTRELAEQVRKVLQLLGAKKHLSVASIYGGMAIGPQIDALKKADIVVATPGRLLDHMERGTINLSKIKTLVLDEADLMFEMGFIDDIDRILQACPKERQTLFFSATISHSLKNLSQQHMKNPTEISATKQVDPTKLLQVYYDVDKRKKFPLLVHLLKQEDSQLVMIFSNTRINTDIVVKNLRANNIKAVGIHGGFSQNKRNNTIEQFKGQGTQVLVCTDVAARGLHINNVSHVYNYDIPRDATDYVHRIGRTARAGENGKVINLLCQFDYENFSKVLENYPDFKIQEEQLPPLERVEMSPNNAQGPRGRSGRSSYEGNAGRGRGRRPSHGRPTDGQRRRY